MKKESIYIAIVIVASVAVPFLINYAYGTCRPIIFTDWGATDALSYWGSVLGGLATLFAVYLAITAEKRKERYQEVSTLLFEALDNLDVSMLFSFKKGNDEKKEQFLYRINQNKGKVGDFISAQELFYLISRAHVCKKLDTRLSRSERNVFEKTLTRLRKYEEEYIKLLQKLREKSEQPEDSILVENVLEKIEKLYEEYDGLADSVQNGLKAFNRL